MFDVGVANIPAIIVSAGPSLRKNQHLLQNAAGKAGLIAGQTTPPPLLGMGIQPHLAPRPDYSHICTRFFERVPKGLRTELGAEPKASAAVFKLYPGPISLLGNELADRMLSPVRAGKTRLRAGATVAHLAFYLAEHLDVPLDFEATAEAGSMLGTTALMIFNETVSVPWAVLKWTEFYAHESCGKCTPCREGTYWLVGILRRMLRGDGTPQDIEVMVDVCDNILGRSFCALGDGATSPITSAIQYFRHEFLELCEKQTAGTASTADTARALSGANA